MLTYPNIKDIIFKMEWAEWYCFYKLVILFILIGYLYHGLEHVTLFDVLIVSNSKKYGYYKILYNISAEVIILDTTIHEGSE